MRKGARLVVLTGLAACVLLTGCSGGSGGVLEEDPSGAEWIGVYGGEGQIDSILSEEPCLNAVVELTLWRDGDGTHVAELWWEQATQGGQDCPIEEQCAPASVFNDDTGSTCFVRDVRGRISGESFAAVSENSDLKMSLFLDRAGDEIVGSLGTEPLSPAYLPFGEIHFQLSRCESLPCDH